MKQLMTTLALSSFIFISGCSGEDTSNNAVPTNYFDETATLQGTVFDGVTGARISDASLKVTLVQGTSYRAASVRTGTQDFAGDYSISVIPLSINNQTQYRLAVSADSYQDFESAIAFDALTGSIIDKNYNYVGNIHLFPLGSKTNDVTILVQYNGEPVDGAMVQLRRSNLNTVGVVAASGASNLYSNINSGFLPHIMATTDASGVATFSGTGLVLGGLYEVEVLPVTHEGIALAMADGVDITVGAIGATNVTGDNYTQVVSLNDLVPGTQDGLYVVSTSNTDANNVNTNGTLTVEFSRPVSLVDETTILATLGGGVVTAVLDATNVPDSTVSAALSADGLTLTLSPNFSTAPVVFSGANGASADNALLVSYSNVRVRLQSANDTGSFYDVFTTLVDTAGVTPSSTVLVTPAF